MWFYTRKGLVEGKKSVERVGQFLTYHNPETILKETIIPFGGLNR
jgi:hypothetical protein